MNEQLNDAKRRIRGQFLGKGGVHGVGVREKENAVAVYVDSGAAPADDLVAAMKQAAAPCGLVVVNEERPVAQRRGGK